MSHYCCKKCGQRYDDCECKEIRMSKQKKIICPIKTKLADNLHEYFHGMTVEEVIAFLSTLNGKALFDWSYHYDDPGDLQILLTETPKEAAERVRLQEERDEAIRKEHRRLQWLELNKEFASEGEILNVT